MNISPIVSLAFSVNSNPGVYALLLGSGVSRSAGIPTGYEITKDLIRKLASLEGVNPEPDPLTWYRLSHGGAPSYTDLLAALAQTPEERNALLRGYFEPTEQEQGASAGGKTPQVAHKAIAALMAAGYIRIVITTNFDRLLERAAEAVGLTPMVIASADAALGAIPLPHAKATIIKVNGDYLDSRIRNTLEELSLYEPPLEQLLDRVLDEFGLIISGWSGDWDFALRSAIKRISNRRFATFWCLRGAVSESVQSLIALRAATAVKIESADSFFQELQEKVFALRELNAEHPLSPLLAAQTVKRFLPRTEDRIRLHDLVLGETEKVYERCSPERFPADATFSPEQLTRRAAAYETITEVLQAMFVVGCYWGGADHESMWVRSVQRLANVSNPAGGPFYESWARMSYYPSLLCAYAGGIAAIAGGKYKTFDSLLWKPIVRRPFNAEESPFLIAVNTGRVSTWEDAQRLNPTQAIKTPLSDHLYHALRPRFRDLIPDDMDFQRAFDEFECLISLSVIHHGKVQNKSHYAPLGSYVWRYMFSEKNILQQLMKEAEQHERDWPPLKAGLFGGSIQAFQEARDALATSERYRRMGDFS